jgi:hypothetical protein
MRRPPALREAAKALVSTLTAVASAKATNKMTPVAFNHTRTESATEQIRVSFQIVRTNHAAAGLCPKC